MFEGSLGELLELSMVDGVLLEIMGAYGVLRIDMPEEELDRVVEISIEKIVDARYRSSSSRHFKTLKDLYSRW